MTTLYVHKECYPKRARERICYVCYAEHVPLSTITSRICNKCMRNLKHPSQYCFICNGRFS